MDELKFLGIGSAFNTDLGNTSSFIKKNNSIILIDCGGTVFHRLQELRILDGVENLYIIITHTHPDHVGSLGEVIFYCHYILKIKAEIFFPQKELLLNFLTNIGVKSEMYNLNSSPILEVDDLEIGKFYVEFLSVPHVDTIPSYGFVMRAISKTFYYSGDSKSIDNSIIDRCIKGEIECIYQDTCGLDYEGNNHLSLTKLCELVPLKLRGKIYCMHLDKHITKVEIEERGFNFAQVFGVD